MENQADKTEQMDKEYIAELDALNASILSMGKEPEEQKDQKDSDGDPTEQPTDTQREEGKQDDQEKPAEVAPKDEDDDLGTSLLNQKRHWREKAKAEAEARAAAEAKAAELERQLAEKTQTQEPPQAQQDPDKQLTIDIENRLSSEIDDWEYLSEGQRETHRRAARAEHMAKYLVNKERDTEAAKQAQLERENRLLTVAAERGISKDDLTKFINDNPKYANVDLEIVADVVEAQNVADKVVHMGTERQSSVPNPPKPQDGISLDEARSLQEVDALAFTMGLAKKNLKVK